MKMTFRWFGPGHDPISLGAIRQIPGISGVITTLFGTQPGEVWKKEDVRGIKKIVEDAGLEISGIESVNIHDQIKNGGPERDKYIDNYIKTLTVLGEEGLNLICYNFMPVFDWTRTDLAKLRPDGSTTMAYDQKLVDEIDPKNMRDSIEKQSKGRVLAGWEPERLDKLSELFEMYKDVDEETLFKNLVYFLKAIMPTCDKYNINMAIHPDDPSWSVFSLPRIISSKEKILRMINAVDNPHNGVTLCTGSLGTNPKNDIPDIISSLKGRIHFAHIRNLLHTSEGVFEESAHLSTDGSMDMFEIVKALYDIGFDGVIRPDHGRTIWGEECIPGYGLYDRAMGAAYLEGLWEAVDKMSRRG